MQLSTQSLRLCCCFRKLADASGNWPGLIHSSNILEMGNAVTPSYKYPNAHTTCFWAAPVITGTRAEIREASWKEKPVSGAVSTLSLTSGRFSGTQLSCWWGSRTRERMGSFPPDANSGPSGLSRHHAEYNFKSAWELHRISNICPHRHGGKCRHSIYLATWDIFKSPSHLKDLYVWL